MKPSAMAQPGPDGLILHPPTGKALKRRPGHKAVIMLLSGGVDSAVAAMLLRDSDFDVAGVTMKIPSARPDGISACCGARAAAVAAELGITHHFLHVSEAFFRHVILPFRHDYLKGQTPNPCMGCNSELKFRLVWDYLGDRLGIQQLATGHYARVARTTAGARLCRAKDRKKDQSYFLYGIPAWRLDDLHLPLGNRTKKQVRELAADAGLSVSNRSESMDLCFAMEDDYRSALPETMPDTSGVIVSTSGKKLGTHRGIWNYTVGQRKGIGIASGEPLYVVSINAQTNAITVGTFDEAMTRDVTAADINILVPEVVAPGMWLYGKIRSGGDAVRCKLTWADHQRIRVRFDRPVFAPAPGQHLVLYTEEGHVAGGGRITG